MVKMLSSLKQAMKETYCIYIPIRKIKDARNILIGDKKAVERGFRKAFGRKLDLTNPHTLNEKIQWLKLYDRRDIHTTLADKYAVREWLAQRFGSEYLVPLLYSTQDWHDIKPENIPDIPCIIKTNNASGTWIICRDKNSMDWQRVRKQFRIWLAINHYYATQEWQYKNIPPRIIVEKLLLTKEGKIPNDYKLHFFNGKLGFVYCSIDREGGNYRNMYGPNWEPLYFSWGAHDEKRGPEIQPPESFGKMVEIGSQIAKLFRYVRVDFYDVDGQLYYGEITMHHGGGFNHFKPESYDLYYGDMLDLHAPVQEDI